MDITDHLETNLATIVETNLVTRSYYSSLALVDSLSSVQKVLHETGGKTCLHSSSLS